MKLHRTVGACAGLAVAGFVMSSSAQIQVAGTLQVNIDASALSTGPLHYVTNNTSLGGVFQAVQNGNDTDPEVIALGGNGSQGIMFSANCLQHLTSLDGSAELPPVGMTGTSPTFSVEAWVFQPLIKDDASVVSWGVRGTCGAQVSCSDGANGTWGGMAMWCNDRGWPGGSPSVGQWHHLVWTLSGGVVHMYEDGAEKLPAPAPVSPNINPNYNILIAAEHETGSLNVITTIVIGRVRIHSGVLSASDVAANYSFEAPSFTNGTPVNLTVRPVHRYSFNAPATNDAVGLTITDNGTIGGAAGVVQGVYGSGSATLSGTRLFLSGGSSATAPYVDLPNGLLSSMSSSNGGSGQLSFEGWVTQTGNQGWSRIFDFGEGSGGELTGPGGAANGTNYFTLIAQPGGDLEHSVVGTQGPGITFGSHFLNNTVHFVLTWDEASGNINVFQNGVQVATWVLNQKMNSITDVNNWLGRSNWTGDSNWQGFWDEFRVYTNILSPGEVLNNYQAGPDTLLTAPGPLQAIHLTLVRTQMMTGTFQQVAVTGDFLNVSNVNVLANPGLGFSTSDGTIATVSAGGLVTAVAPGGATITASLQGKTDGKLVTVVPLSATLAHRYSFTDSGNTGADVSDSVGGAAWDGTVQNSAFTSSGQLYLDGISAFADLPPGIISNMDAVTIETWASFNALSTWAELYAFGIQGSPTGPGGNMISFIPHSGGSDYRMSINDGAPGGAHEEVAGVPGNLDNQSNVHIVAVYNPLGAWIKLYTNGVLVAQNTNVTAQLTGVYSMTNWLGRSLWNDPYVYGSIDEFRVWNGVLTPDRIALDAATGPNQIVSDPGALQSVSLTAGTTLFLNGTEQAQFTGNFANVANVNLIGYDTPVLTSANPAAVTVSSSGLIRAVGLGSSLITGTYSGHSSSITVTVQPRPLTMLHRYSFTSDGTDSIGGANASVFGGTFSGGQWIMNAVNQDFAQLPGGVVTNLQALTIEAWASFGANANWCRLWDFGDISGNNGQNYFMLSPHSGNSDTFLQLRPTGIGADETVERAPILDNQTNVHIVAVVYPAVSLMQLYLNGFLAGQITNATAPLAGIHDNYNYIGHSLFASDAFLNGAIDEFRIYDGVINQQQVALDTAAGPDLLVSNPGSLVRVRFSVPNTNLLADQSVQAALFADFVNVSNVNLFAYASPAPTFSSGNTNVVTVTPLGLVTAVGKGTAILTATYNSQNYTLQVQVGVTPIALKHHYDFNGLPGDSTVRDLVDGADGVVTNRDGGVVTDGFNGLGQLQLNGTNDFVELPSRLLSTLSNVTLEVWVTSTTLNNWSRVLDFGSSDAGPGLAGSGTNYLFISPTPIIRFTTRVTLGAGGEVPIIDDPSPLLFNQLSEIVAVYNVSAGVATLYVNGVKIGTGSIVMPLYLLNDENDWLGRSQFAGDPLFLASYDDFRIWEGALTPGEAAASYAAGPNSLPLPRLQIRATGSNLTVSWPLWASRYTLYHSSVLGGAWTPVAATLVSDAAGFHVTVPQSGAIGFYRLAQ